MPNGMTAWKTDNYKFVGKAFEYSYANFLNKMKAILGEANVNSVDYELTGSGGYGELLPYDGNNLNFASKKRGFKTVIVPQEFTLSDAVGKKEAKIDKMGECRKIGTKLGHATAMTVYLHAMRMFANAFKASCKGGDGKPWAATDHPVASKGSNGRQFIADPDSGTFSNLMTLELSVHAITEMETKANRFVTPDGLPFLGQYNMLLVSPELAEMAEKICGRDGKWRPHQNPDSTANTYANPLPDLQYMVLGGGKDGFTGKQWALCDATLMKEMCKIVYISKPEVLQNELDNPLKDCYTGYVDFGVGWGDARPIIFSNPA